jgi:adenylylsulfate kinase
MQTLVARDTKGLYAKALRGELSHVVGVDIAFPPPTDADMEIDTSQAADIAALAQRILASALQ